MTEDELEIFVNDLLDGGKYDGRTSEKSGT